jgi:hypothetical protein
MAEDTFMSDPQNLVGSGLPGTEYRAENRPEGLNSGPESSTQSLPTAAITAMLSDLQQQIASLSAIVLGQQSTQSTAKIAEEKSPESTERIKPESLSRTALEEGLVKELSKRVYTFPESAKLIGPENFDQWKQALRIIFRALKLNYLLDNFYLVRQLADSEQAVILLLLRESCTTGPQNAICWVQYPDEAWNILAKQYSLTISAQRDTYYRDLHALNLKTFKGTLTEFNAEFNSLLYKLENISVKIEMTEVINTYLKALELVYPQWTERLRSTVRTLQATNTSTEALNLQYFMADILQEQRTPGSSVSNAKGTINNASIKKGAKKPKKKNDNTESSTAEQSKNSSKNTPANSSKKKNKKAKNSGISSSSSDPYTCITGFYSDNLDISYTDTDSDSDDSVIAIPTINTANTGKIGREDLLYDTGTTDHIVNSRRWYILGDYKPNKGDIKPLYTGGGPVTPHGSGTAVFTVAISLKPLKYGEIHLKNALYLPGMDVNLMSG